MMPRSKVYDDRVLLSLLAYTAIEERIFLAEEEERQALRNLFVISRDRVAGELASRALNDAEASERAAILREQHVDGYRLSIVLSLMNHYTPPPPDPLNDDEFVRRQLYQKDFAAEASDMLSLVAFRDVEDNDEEKQRAAAAPPSTAEGDQMQSMIRDLCLLEDPCVVIPHYAMPIEQLREALRREAVVTWERFRSLEAKELSGRRDIISLEAQSFALIHRVEAFGRRETLLLEEIAMLEDLFGIGIPLEEGRLQLRLLQLSNRELDERERLIAEYIAERRMLDLRAAESVEWVMTIVERANAVRRAMRQHAAVKALPFVTRRAIQETLGSRFHTWMRRSEPVARRRKQVATVNHRALESQRTLLARYCAAWNRPIEARREQAAIRSLTEQGLQQALFISTIEEPYERTVLPTLYLEELPQRRALEVQYYHVLEERRHAHRQAALTTLLRRTAWRHRMRRLTTWYRWWKDRGGQRRAAWMVTRVADTLLRRSFFTLMRYTTRRAIAANELFTIEIAACTALECTFLEWSSDVLRAVVERHEATTRIADVEDQFARELRWAKMATKSRLVTYIEQQSSTLLLKKYFVRLQKKCERRGRLVLAVTLNHAVGKQYLRDLLKRFQQGVQLRKRLRDVAKSLVDEETASRKRMELEHFEGWARLALSSNQQIGAYRLHVVKLRRKIIPQTRLTIGRGLALDASHSLQTRRVTLIEMTEMNAAESSRLHGLDRWMTWGRFMLRMHRLWLAREILSHVAFTSDLDMLADRFKRLRRYARSRVQARWDEAIRERTRLASESLVKEEDSERTAHIEEETWARTRVALARERNEKRLRRIRMEQLSDALARSMDLGLMRITFRKLATFATRHKRRMKMIPRVRRMAAECNRKLLGIYMGKWLKRWYRLALPGIVNSMALTRKVELLRRYFSKLSPSLVRRTRLQHARASRLPPLQRVSSASRKRDELPPLRNRTEPELVVASSSLLSTFPSSQEGTRHKLPQTVRTVPLRTAPHQQRPPSPLFKTVKQRRDPTAPSQEANNSSAAPKIQAASSSATAATAASLPEIAPTGSGSSTRGRPSSRENSPRPRVSSAGRNRDDRPRGLPPL